MKRIIAAALIATPFAAAPAFADRVSTGEDGTAEFIQLQPAEPETPAASVLMETQAGVIMPEDRVSTGEDGTAEFIELKPADPPTVIYDLREAGMDDDTALEDTALEPSLSLEGTIDPINTINDTPNG